MSMEDCIWCSVFSVVYLSKVDLRIAVVELANGGSENTGYGTAADILGSVGMPTNEWFTKI